MEERLPMWTSPTRTAVSATKVPSPTTGCLSPKGRMTGDMASRMIAQDQEEAGGGAEHVCQGVESIRRAAGGELLVPLVEQREGGAGGQHQERAAPEARARGGATAQPAQQRIHREVDDLVGLPEGRRRELVDRLRREVDDGAGVGEEREPGPGEARQPQTARYIFHLPNASSPSRSSSAGSVESSNGSPNRSSSSSS